MALAVDPEQLRAEICGQEWYHTLELAEGVVTPGWFDHRDVIDRLPLPVSLEGKLVWSDNDFGWNADWRLVQEGKERGTWSVRGVSFDDAYRAGVGGAAELLSP